MLSTTLCPLLSFDFWGKGETLSRHGGSYPERKVFWEINDTIVKFIKVRFNIQLIGRDWTKIVDELQEIRSHTSFKLIRWNPPKDGWFKGNSDGASKENPGPSSIAFCIRNNKGELMVAKGQRIHNTTSLEAKALAIRECMQYCSDNSIVHIIMESDSWSMVQILSKVWEVPWSIAMVVKSIGTLIENLSVRVIHFHRKCNTLADFFANLIFDFAGDFHFNNVEQVPWLGKAIIELDKKGTPNIRRISQNDC